LFAALIAGPAAGEDIVANYNAYWAGLPAANIRLTLRDAGIGRDGSVGYQDEIEITTQGLPHLLSRFRATASAEGRLAADPAAEQSGRRHAAGPADLAPDRRLPWRNLRGRRPRRRAAQGGADRDR